MAHEPIAASRFEFSAQLSPLLEPLYVKAEAARWGLSRKRFIEALQHSVEKRFRDVPANPLEVEGYLQSLHLEDLALACACAEGIDCAWDFFVARFRQELRGASRAILRSSGPGNDAQAEELADSLYADLYGIRSTGGGRRASLLDSFHGRSKLATWLRAVLAQRYVDFLRSSSRTTSLEIDTDESPLEVTRGAEAAPPDPARARYIALIDRALSIALANLLPRERLLLACYYVDQLTLAQIGKMIGEHESTVSRQLECTRRTLRESVTEMMRRGVPERDGRTAAASLDDSQLEVAFQYAVEDWAFDLPRALSNAKAVLDRARE